MMQVGTASEVAEAYSRYSFGVDNARAEVVESCFAPEVILGLAGCGSSGGSCGGSGAIKGPTMLPVRLIQGAN